jgi:hypothetical protein
MTENGWPACGPDMLDRNPIPGTSIVIPLQRGIPNVILKAAAADIHQFVESLNNGRAGSSGGDEGGWTGTNSVPTSNHLGGTAMDLNWNDHPFRVNWAGWDANERRVLEELFGTKQNSRGPGAGWYEGMVFFAQHWDNPIDPMHFQMGYGTYQDIARCNDFIRRKIRADGFSTFRRGGTGGGTIPPVVVQPSYWAELGPNGEHVKRLQAFLNTRGAGLDVDGDFGPLTEQAVRAFQRGAGIDADGIVGPITLEKLKAAGFKPDGGNVIAVPPKPWPQSATDRELLEYIAEQQGPGHKDWPANGPGGVALTQRDSIAAWGKALTEIAEAR